MGAGKQTVFLRREPRSRLGAIRARTYVGIIYDLYVRMQRAAAARAVPSPVPEKHESSDGKKGHSVALSVYGSPVSRGSSANDAFQSNAEERIAHLAPCDILVTHAPLSSQVVKTIAPLVHVYGHIHERYGISHVPVRVNNKTRSIISVCASIMDRRYHPSHSPIVVDIPVKSVTGR